MTQCCSYCRNACLLWSFYGSDYSPLNSPGASFLLSCVCAYLPLDLAHQSLCTLTPSPLCRGLTEPAHLLLADGSDVITGTPTNRLGVFVGRDADAKFSATKLKPECFKGESWG